MTITVVQSDPHAALEARKTDLTLIISRPVTGFKQLAAGAA
jgi:hypothetical protein